MCLAEISRIVDPLIVATNETNEDSVGHNLASHCDCFIDVGLPEEYCYSYMHNDSGKNNDNYSQIFFCNK